MQRRSNRRVSFHKDVTVKEFIKTNTSQDDAPSPDLYHAPINHRGQDMDETGVSEDSNMELTFTGTDSPTSCPGELTMMISRDTRAPITGRDSVHVSGCKPIGARYLVLVMGHSNYDYQKHETDSGSVVLL